MLLGPPGDARLLTTYVLVIAGAFSGFSVQQHFALRTLPLSVLIVVIGMYGALAVAAVLAAVR